MALICTTYRLIEYSVYSHHNRCYFVSYRKAQLRVNMIGCAAFYRSCNWTCAFGGLYRALSRLYWARIERCFRKSVRPSRSAPRYRIEDDLRPHRSLFRVFLISLSIADQIDSAIG
jgi:hypothetical protein